MISPVEIRPWPPTPLNTISVFISLTLHVLCVNNALILGVIILTGLIDEAAGNDFALQLLLCHLCSLFHRNALLVHQLHHAGGFSLLVIAAIVRGAGGHDLNHGKALGVHALNNELAHLHRVVGRSTGDVRSSGRLNKLAQIEIRFDMSIRRGCGDAVFRCGGGILTASLTVIIVVGNNGGPIDVAGGAVNTKSVG